MQRYVCINPLCRCQILATRASLDAQGNPKCYCCGAEMKKPYAQPVFREVSPEPSAIVKTKKHGAC